MLGPAPTYNVEYADALLVRIRRVSKRRLRGDPVSTERLGAAKKPI